MQCNVSSEASWQKPCYFCHVRYTVTGNRNICLLLFSSVQSLSCVWLFPTPGTAVCQASLSIINSWSLLKLMSIELVMPSNHLVLCHPLTLFKIEQSVDCNTPGFPIHHQLPELAQAYVHRVGDAIQPSPSLSIPFFSCLRSFPASGSFLMSQLFTSGDQSIGVSASATVLPMNIQDLFPLGWTPCCPRDSQESSLTP